MVRIVLRKDDAITVWQLIFLLHLLQEFYSRSPVEEETPIGRKGREGGGREGRMDERGRDG